MRITGKGAGMPFNEAKGKRFSAGLVLAALVVFSYSWGVLCPDEGFCAESILHLTPDKEDYYLGPYLDYLEDPEKKLTIDEAASPESSSRFEHHTRKIINFGSSSSAYWFRFTVVEANNDRQKKWLLYLGWPNYIDRAQLYIPEIEPGAWKVKEVGRFLPDGPVSIPNIPTELQPAEGLAHPTTFYLRVESSAGILIPLKVLTGSAYQHVLWAKMIWSGVYYGIMLAMFLYNLMLLVSLRELFRLYYLLYVASVGLLFFSLDEGFFILFNLDVRLGRLAVHMFAFFAYFWAILFGKSFLSTKKYAPGPDKVLTVFATVTFLAAVAAPFVDPYWRDYAANILALVVPPVFILTGAVCLKNGFRPARFYLIAFISIATGTLVNALTFYNVLPTSDLTLNGIQIGSAIEVILLQLALVDRVNTIRLERDRIKQSLYLTGEIQQTLLPHQNPDLPGLDIAGRSRYCDETGGDHYDFIQPDAHDSGRIGLVISDVSGHGLPSALLMATARSGLRQRAAMSGSLAEVISDVNRQISADVEQSGQFLTMFYCEIDLGEKTVRWVSAGHDPALVYDLRTDAFDELKGRGPALGLMDDFQYPEFSRNLSPGNIILLATDGVWEAHNQNGEMFGKDRLRVTLRFHRDRPAGDIVDAVIQAVEKFCHPREIEDDITLLVIKVAH